MNPGINRRSLLLAALLSGTAIYPGTSSATIVEFQTVIGNFEVNLYDNDTPATVANFLDYVNNGAYTNSVYHRSAPGFVVQGGGFTFGMALPLNTIPTNPAVTNEPEFSNVRGTIAMAKLGNDPNRRFYGIWRGGWQRHGRDRRDCGTAGLQFYGAYRQPAAAQLHGERLHQQCSGRRHAPGHR